MNVTFSFIIPHRIQTFFQKHEKVSIGILLSLISIISFLYYYGNGLGLAYSDARSHLDIARRVVEGLQPGFAQLGSVWLPLPHILMLMTIWNDFMWHSGLSGALSSMVGYVVTGLLLYSLLKQFGVSLLGRIIGVGIFALNINVFYMQATAMTELILLAAMTAGVYELILWHKEETTFRLIRCAFWIMLATLIRYDGWFLFFFAALLIGFHTIRKFGMKTAEGVLLLFLTLGGFGIFLWFLWNLIIFKDPLYFAFGAYSAHAQQTQLSADGFLATKDNLFLSIRAYMTAVIDNTSTLTVVMSVIGMFFFWSNKKISSAIRLASVAFLSPLFFNVLALYLGHSALFVKGVPPIPDGWFNVRYGVMMIPAFAFFLGYCIDRLQSLRLVIIGALCLFSVISFVNQDAVTLEDAYGGLMSSHVASVTTWLHEHAANQNGYILVSVYSHDGVIFSSGLPMNKFIHEGTGLYWDLVTAHPDRYARWIVLNPDALSDAITRELAKTSILHDKYQKVASSAYVSVYELKPEYISDLRPLPNLSKRQ